MGVFSDIGNIKEGESSMIFACYLMLDPGIWGNKKKNKAHPGIIR